MIRIRRDECRVRPVLLSTQNSALITQYTDFVFRTIPPPPERLLVFARLPEAGKVKTRLARSIGEAKALAVYEAMLRDLLASIGPSSKRMEVEILWSPSADANGDLLRRAFGNRATAMQTGATLGDRIAMAFPERFFFHRTEKAVALGVA